MMYINQSATLGSDMSAYHLKQAFLFDSHGMPQDKEQSAYWFRKVVDGHCEHKQVKADLRAYAVEMLARAEAGQ